MKAIGGALEDQLSRQGKAKVDLENAKNAKAEAERALTQGQGMLADLTKICATRKQEDEKRQKLRQEELQAIHETIKILNDDDALELFKKTLPSTSFAQQQTSARVVVDRALAAMRHVAQPSRALDLIAVALSGKRSVDFSKVIKLIDEMVVLLGKEQTADEEKKNYCNSKIDLAEDAAKEFRSPH